MTRIGTRALVAFSLIAFTGAAAYAQSTADKQSTQQDKVQYDRKQNQDIQGGKKPEESHRASGRDQGVDPHTKVDESKEGAATGAGAAAGATGAAAQEPRTEQRPDRRQAQGGEAMNLSSISAEKLIGMKVQDRQGKDIGEIKDVIVNLQTGQIQAAVLEFGGILGIGEKAYAFPVSEIQQGKKRNQLVVNVDKQRLEKTEGFERNAWPGMDDDFWGRIGLGKDKADPQARGTLPPGKAGEGMRLVRASELKGKEVQAKAGGEDIAEVEDVILDIKGGKVRNIVLDVEDGGRVNVQPSQLSAGADEKKLVLAMDAQQLKQQAKPRRDERRPAAAGSTIRPADQPDRAVEKR